MTTTTTHKPPVDPRTSVPNLAKIVDLLRDIRLIAVLDADAQASLGWLVLRAIGDTPGEAVDSIRGALSDAVRVIFRSQAEAEFGAADAVNREAAEEAPQRPQARPEAGAGAEPSPPRGASQGLPQARRRAVVEAARAVLAAAGRPLLAADISAELARQGVAISPHQLAYAFRLEGQPSQRNGAYLRWIPLEGVSGDGGAESPDAADG